MGPKGAKKRSTEAPKVTKDSKNQGQIRPERARKYPSGPDKAKLHQTVSDGAKQVKMGPVGPNGSRSASQGQTVAEGAQ